MACFHPIKGWRSPGGKVTFRRGEAYVDLPRVSVSCGQCVGCRLERSRQWAMRCLHEAQLHEKNNFLTLTYNNDTLPSSGSLVKSDLQKFFKRYRKRCGKLRYMACGEYGDNTARPHYHAVVFGHDWPDRELLKTSGDNRVYTSELLKEIWPSGHHAIGDVTFDSAAYVARYIMQKITGPLAEDYYTRFDGKTGECWIVEPEFNVMSRRPGIGAEWFRKFKSDAYPSDSVHIRGKAMRPPTFYDKLYELDDPEGMKHIRAKRQERLRDRKEDFTEERLKVRETVTKARLNLYGRNEC